MQYLDFAHQADTALINACVNGDTATLAARIKAGVDLETRAGLGKTYVHIACEWGNNQCLKLLLDAKANADAPDALGKHPMHIVCRTGDVKCLALLLASSADPTRQTQCGSPLAIARSFKKLECVRLCMAYTRREEPRRTTRLSVGLLRSFTRVWRCFCFGAGRRASRLSALACGLLRKWARVRAISRLRPAI